MKKGIPFLTFHQEMVLDEIINGSVILEIEEGDMNTRYELTDDNGNSRPIMYKTFKKLLDLKLIKHAYSPSLEVRAYK